MCIYIMHMFIENPYFSYYVAIQNGFRVSAGSVLGTDYHSNRCSVWFRVSSLGAQRLHPIRIRPVVIPSLSSVWPVGTSQALFVLKPITPKGILREEGKKKRKVR